MFYCVFHVPFFKYSHQAELYSGTARHRFNTPNTLNMTIGCNRLAYTIFLQYVCARFDKKNIRYAAHTNG
jgi:hypothetical protein